MNHPTRARETPSLIENMFKKAFSEKNSVENDKICDLLNFFFFK